MTTGTLHFLKRSKVFQYETFSCSTKRTKYFDLRHKKGATRNWNANVLLILNKEGKRSSDMFHRITTMKLRWGLKFILQKFGLLERIWNANEKIAFQRSSDCIATANENVLK
jgi:hypothetical protein